MLCYFFLNLSKIDILEKLRFLARSFSASCVLTCPVESKPNSRMIKTKTISVVLMAIFNHRQKIAAARMPTRTPSNGLERANQNETFQPEPWALGFVFILFFSSVRRSTFHRTRNFFRNVERTQENLDRRVWTRGLGENATWLRPHHDFRAGSASHRYRGLRLVVLVLPLGEQRELVRCPIGP